MSHWHWRQIDSTLSFAPPTSGAPSSISPKSESSVSAKACAIVEDAPSSSSSSSPSGLSTPRNLPPDGTSFSQISLGSSGGGGVSLSPTVAAYGYWNAQFFHASPGYVRFQLEVPRGASFGVYARRNALPTHTTYDLMEVVKGVAADGDGGDSGRTRRAAKVGREY